MGLGAKRVLVFLFILKLGGTKKRNPWDSYVFDGEKGFAHRSTNKTYVFTNYEFVIGKFVAALADSSLPAGRQGTSVRS